MKKSFIYIAALTLIVACNKVESPVPSQESDIITAQIEQETATKTYMDANNNILWSEGDQIVGFMKSSLGLKYRILSSSVGKTYASFENVSDSNGNINSGTEWDHNIVYYPYSEIIEAEKSGSNYTLDVVLPSEQTYAAESFGNGAMAMVAVSEDNNITFRNVLGALKLQLKGTQTVKSIKVTGKNNEILSGSAVVTAYTNGLAPAITMTATDKASKSVSLVCTDGVQLSESKATEFIIALPPVLFSKGFTVTVTDSESQTYTVETDKANTVLRSSILTMPAFTLGQTPGDDEDDDATYIEYLLLDKTSLTMYPEASYALVADIYPVEVTYPTLAWSSSDNTVATVDQTGKITTVSDGTATITAVAVGGLSAACTVTVKSATTKEVKDYIADGQNYGPGIKIGQTIWAPVNCGYEPANGAYKGYPYGKLYQWGRKYGLGYGTDYDATNPVIANGPVKPTVGISQDNKNVFYKVTTSPYDWSQVQDGDFWNSGTESKPDKTNTDPCPDGWRVPTYDELEYLSRNFSSWTTNSAGQKGYYLVGEYTYIDSVPQVFFPAAGFLYYSNGKAWDRGTYGRYWSSRPSSTNASNLNFDSGYVYMGSNYRAFGFSVRCVQK